MNIDDILQIQRQAADILETSIGKADNEMSADKVLKIQELSAEIIRILIANINNGVTINQDIFRAIKKVAEAELRSSDALGWK